MNKSMTFFGCGPRLALMCLPYVIVFIIPALAIIFHSGLILSISFVLYLGFKISIHGETNVLKRIFGNEYELYERSVNEIIPFPRYLFQGKRNKN